MGRFKKYIRKIFGNFLNKDPHHGEHEYESPQSSPGPETTSHPYPPKSPCVGSTRWPMNTYRLPSPTGTSSEKVHCPDENQMRTWLQDPRSQRFSFRDDVVKNCIKSEHVVQPEDKKIQGSTDHAPQHEEDHICSLDEEDGCAQDFGDAPEVQDAHAQHHELEDVCADLHSEYQDQERVSEDVEEDEGPLEPAVEPVDDRHVGVEFKVRPRCVEAFQVTMKEPEAGSCCSSGFCSKCVLGDEI